MRITDETVRFEFRDRGLVVINDDGLTDLPAGRKLRAIVVPPDGSALYVEAAKEYGHSRIPTLRTIEGVLLLGLSKADVPVGSEVTVMLANDDPPAADD